MKKARSFEQHHGLGLGFISFGFELEEGMKINVISRIQLMEPEEWSYLHCHWKAEPDLGALAIPIWATQKVDRRGSFRIGWKQALPQFPERSGVILSQKWGRDSLDIITTVSRHPECRDCALPTKVQGEGHLVRWLLIFQRPANGIWMSWLSCGVVQWRSLGL